MKYAKNLLVLLSLITVYAGAQPPIQQTKIVTGNTSHVIRKTASMAEINEGVYFIKINQTGKYAAIENISKDNGAKLVQWAFVNAGNHKFLVSRTKDGYYLIKAIHSNRYLNVAGAATNAGALIIQYDYADQDNVKWIISKEDVGMVLRNKQTGLSVMLANTIQNPDNGVAIVLNGNENAGRQTFSFEPAEGKQVMNSTGGPGIIPSTKPPSIKYVLAPKPFDMNVDGVRYRIANNQSMAKKMAGANGMKYYQSRKPEETDGTEVLPNGSVKTCTVSFQRLSLETMDMDVVSREVIDNIKPGIVYDLTDVQRKGKYLEYRNQKNPITLSLNAPNVRNPSLIVNNPNDIVEMTNGTNELLNRPASAIPLGLEEFKFTQIRNEDEFRLAIGVGFGSPFVSGSTLFNMDKRNKTEKFLFQYRWTGYSLQATPSVSGMFANAEENINPSLVYVDKITYGSRILVSFELNESNENFSNQTKVNGSYGFFSANANFLFSNSSLLKNVTFKMVAWGVRPGTSGVVISASGVDDLKAKLGKLITDLKASENVPSAWGIPITYSLRFLDGTTAVASAGIDELPQRYCTISDSVLQKTVNIKLVTIKPNGDCDAYGRIWVQCFDGLNTPIGEANNLDNLIDISKKAHLGESGAADPSGLFGRQNSFTIRADSPKDPRRLKGAYLKIWGWINDDDSSGDDVMQLRNGVRQQWSPGFSPWMQIIPLDLLNNDPSKKMMSFTQGYYEDGDGCDLMYQVTVK